MMDEDNTQDMADASRLSPAKHIPHTASDVVSGPSSAMSLSADSATSATGMTTHSSSPRPSPVPSPVLPHKNVHPAKKKSNNGPLAPSSQCPRVNCPEKIVLCLDLSHEMEKVTFRTRAGDKFPPLPLVKRALGLFMHLKHKINSKHQFALVILHQEAQWMHNFTSDPTEIISLLEELDRTHPCETFAVESLFDLVFERVCLPKVENHHVIPPPYVVRVVFIYGRSHCRPSFKSKESQKILHTSPHFFLDAFYIHESPSEDNDCEEIFDLLCDLDINGNSYIFEVSKNPTRLYDCVAQLLAHPLQRPLQKDTSYTIESDEADVL